MVETHDESPLAAALLNAIRQPDTTVVVCDPVWTPERAEQFIQEISESGRRLLCAAADGNGRVDAEKFREHHGERALYGPSAVLTKTVNRGIREGWLPEGAELPLSSTFDGRSSWSKTDGYRLPAHLAAIFRDAFDRVYPAGAESLEGVIDHLAEVYEQAGREPVRARAGRSLPRSPCRRTHRVGPGTRPRREGDERMTRQTGEPLDRMRLNPTYESARWFVSGADCQPRD
ncbi:MULTISPECIES: hypothetical protein [unclassified Streptomyces]|uniref:hypothetical protein n=1 Tax=unclassified Streptomyces TaxID=2593676 RepID=UPI00070D6E33|nr:hypothetical protein [Streptomyces sp. Root1310]KQX77049.1 hypothetical protein ASD48_38345 [Streptomyces sp. Root1310]